ncbi:hypothetical protein OH77DRAFT_1019092 [Trametes cingulata]|nr:hypothetical protein OH77DRAFT_1019092 [Trametes cingulata]
MIGPCAICAAHWPRWRASERGRKDRGVWARQQRLVARWPRVSLEKSDSFRWYRRVRVDVETLQRATQPVPAAVLSRPGSTPITQTEPIGGSGYEGDGCRCCSQPQRIRPSPATAGAANPANLPVCIAIARPTSSDEPDGHGDCRRIMAWHVCANHRVQG